MLATQLPSMNSALPIPVPSVTTTTVPACPLPAPKAISATPAASASFIDRDRPAQLGAEQRRRVDADPCGVDVGRGLDDPVPHHRRHRDPDRTRSAELADDVGDRVADRLGGGGRRATSRTRSAVSSPRVTSTGAPLIPVPPTSTPVTGPVAELGSSGRG